MTALVTGLRGLGPLKLGALGLVALLSFGLLGMMAMRGSAVPMGMLYADLDLREAGQVVDQLDRARIPHEAEAGGTRILVPTDQVARARMLLAKEGLPSGGSIGYEIFDRADGLTASAFQQAVSQTRALEGELARTIRTLQGVRGVRVHLVLPRREPFARERQESQASVALTMSGAARLDREGVQAVLNLIAAAVPGLKAQNIAIIDSRGNLLARAGQPTDGLGAARTADELKRGTETRIARAVEEMLERTVGAGHVRAEATVELDFDQIREVQEKYDPDGQVVRSQQNSSGNTRSTEATPNVSVQNNLPNPEPTTGGAGSQEQKTDETTNYEIGKTVRTVVREQPQLKRLSLAVMVDGVTNLGSDGRPVWTARAEEELARIGNLVRSAVGYDERRGDRVEVVSMRFAAPEETPETAALPVWARLDKADLMRLVETGLLALAVLVTLAFVMRPMVLRLALAGGASAGALTGPEGMQLADVSAGGPAQVGSTAPPAGQGVPAIAGAGAALTPVIAAQARQEEMMQVAKVEGELRAAAIRRVTDLMESHPEASVAMIRGWVAEGGER